MSEGHGARTWFIPDAYYPSCSSGSCTSHEAVCVLNTGTEDANIEIKLYFEDRDSMEGFKAVCKAGRTNHIRMDRIRGTGGNCIPQGVPYAMMVVSDSNIVVQYSRMDTTQAEMALMGVIAYPL